MKTFIKYFIGFVVVLALSGWIIGSYLSPDDLAKCDTTPSAKAGCEPAGAIVAVSGGDTAARTAEAIKLYKNGWADLLIFSGAAADKSGPSNAEVMRNQAIDAGISPLKIITEENSQTTTENATETTSIFEEHGIESAIIVTSGYHERRATLEFERRATSVKLRSHPVATDKHWGPWWWLTPSGWMLAIPELVRSLILSTGGVDRT
ncbi:MAG: YdcF family protein [Candidatus Saccharimonas sp.]